MLRVPGPLDVLTFRGCTLQICRALPLHKRTSGVQVNRASAFRANVRTSKRAVAQDCLKSMG